MVRAVLSCRCLHITTTSKPSSSKWSSYFCHDCWLCIGKSSQITFSYLTWSQTSHLETSWVAIMTTQLPHWWVNTSWEKKNPKTKHQQHKTCYLLFNGDKGWGINLSQNSVLLTNFCQPRGRTSGAEGLLFQKQHSWKGSLLGPDRLVCLKNEEEEEEVALNWHMGRSRGEQKSGGDGNTAAVQGRVSVYFQRLPWESEFIGAHWLKAT